MPPSSLAGAPPSMDPISAIISLQTLPISNSNINELRSFSTALSEFISRYDELNTHINIINSSIDSILLPPNRLAEDVTVSVQNQNPSSSENTTFSSSCEEIDAYKKLEDVDVSNNRVEIDVYENDCVEIDALEKPGAAGLSNNRLEIDVSESYVEVNALKKPGDADLSYIRLEVDVYENSYVEIDALEKPEAAGLSNNRLEVDVSESYVEIDALKKPGDADLSNNRLEIDVSESYVEIDALKKSGAVDLSNNRLEIDVSENNYVEVDALEKPQAAGLSNNQLEIDALEKPEDADVSNNRLEVDVSENNYVEINVLKKLEGADVFEIPIEINTLKTPEVASTHVQIDTRGRDINVCENNVGIDSLNNGFLHDYDESGVSKKPEVADVLKDHVGIDSLNSGFSHDYDESDVLKKLEVADVSKDHEEIDEFENRVEIDSLKKPEEIEVCEDPVEIDSLKTLEVANNPVQIDACGEIDVLENFEEVDVCENHVENDSLNMQEETVPESSCDETMTDVSGAVVSEQNHNRMAAHGKQSNENVRIPECVVEIDVLVHKKHEQAGILKKPEQIDICKNSEEIVVFKNHEEFHALMIPEEIVVSKKLEETVPETSCDRTIPIVSEKIRNKLDFGKPESLKEVRKKKKRYRKRRREFIPFSKNPVIFKLQSKCRNMSTKKLKVHVAAHYSEMIDLREEIANALKLAEDPAKLVLRSIGRFFVISSERIRMHAGGSHPLTVERKALVLILECFVMISSDGIEIARQDREYAAKTAVDWRKRMINEGGLGHTDEVDARGLLLLIGGFGIQDDVFTIQDIMDLIRASNVKGISTALRRSAFLIPKIPEVIYLMVKNNLETEAVDIVSAFGLEDVCHPRNILTTTLHNKIKDIQNASPLQMEETVPESSCDETMADAPGAVVSEQNRNRMAANGKQSNENVRTPECVEEIDVSVHKQHEQTDVFKKPEQIDICKNVEETVVLKKHEEFDTLMIQEEIVVSKKLEETIPETSCDRTIAIVLEQNPNIPALRTPESLEESLEEVGKMKRKEAKDELYRAKRKMRLEKALARSAAIISELEKKKDSCGNFDTLIIQEEIVPETAFDRTIAIVSGKTRKGLALRTPESLEEVRNMKRKQVKDELLHKMEWAQMKKSRLEKALATSAAIISALEKKKESRGYFDNSMIPEEIGTCKKPEESLPETSCDQTITTVPKAIVSEQNPNRMAANVSTPECVEETDVSVSKKPEQINICKNPEETVASNKPDQNGTLKKAKGTGYLISVLQSMCQNMSHKKLRRHIETHYSEMIDLREEIANALKLAKDPAKLVLYTIGRFFVLHTIAFRPCVSSHKKDDNIRRLAAVLILECFVMISSDGIEIEKRDREYVAEVAVVWRKRMIKEGGLGHTDEVDARGLLLLISGFGIQDDVFNIQDIMDLLRASNVKGISTALRRSIFLIPKIPEVIYLMVKNNLEIEAVDIANTFGLEDACNRRNILTTNLHNKIKDIQNAPPLQMNNENVITPESLEEVDILKKPEETAALMKPEEIDILKKPEEIAALKKPDEVNILEKLISVLTKPEEADTLISEENDTWKKTKETGVVSVLQSICRRMNSKKLVRHIKKHISEMNNLRVDIASALKLAEDPAKLVKNSIGRVFERNSKEFRPRAGSHLNNHNVGRMAVVLILECFVMISDDGIEITETVWQNAADAAAVLRNQIIKEGGLRHADEVDARGLLLLISGFGIQDHVFSIQDLIDLIRASNVKGIATALRRSVFLMPKIPEIINKMVHNNLELEAVDIAYAFGLEDTYHPGKILTAYLDNKIKDIQNASPDHMLDAVKQHLLDLKSVKQCLESHNVDPSTLLPDFKINERIQNLEKEVNEWKLIHKRKSKENPIHHEPKRACVSHQNMPHQQRPPVGHCRPPQLNTSYITAHSASPGNTPGYYVQAVHMANGQPYGWRGPYGQPYPGHGQTYVSQPYHRPWEQGQLAQLASFPGILGSRPPSSDLYRFADFVEKGTRGSRP